MTDSGPNFSPFPFDRLRRVRRGDAAIESVLARWLAARPRTPHKLAALFGGVPAIAIAGVRQREELGRSPTLVGPDTVVVRKSRERETPAAITFDRHAALAELRVAGMSILVTASLAPIRALAQRLVGGATELDAPRPPTSVDHAIWALVVAAAITDFGLAAEVWPFNQPVVPDDAIGIELVVTLPNQAQLTVMAWCPRELAVRVPPPRPVPDWRFTVPILVGRCELPPEAIAALALRDVVVIERELALVVGDSLVGLTADLTAGAMEVQVATGYVPRAMADSAHLELTVQCGSTAISLRDLATLAPGQIVPLGRPLAGPYEIRAGGTLIGQGELVDVDGELGVRIVSLVGSPDA